MAQHGGIGSPLPLCLPFHNFRHVLDSRRHTCIRVLVVLFMHDPPALLLDHLAALAIHHASLQFHVAFDAAQLGDTLDPTGELGQ